MRHRLVGKTRRNGVIAGLLVLVAAVIGALLVQNSAGASGTSTRQVQWDLAGLGYLPWSGIDGANGPQTKGAVRSFQSDRCLAAGMDDYLTKPLTLDRLRQAVAHWAMDHTDEPAVDRSIVEEMFGGNEKAVARVLARFREAGARMVAEIDATRDNPERLKELSHKLKGAARAAGATVLGDLAARLEKSGRGVDVDAVRTEWHRVVAELNPG